MRGSKAGARGARKVGDVSPEARRRASVILEVLAGVMTPTSAAKVLSCSPPRYYGLEAQALAGLVAACEPRPVGYAHTAERELEALKRRHARLERECARYQALSRAAQRAAGLSEAKVKQARAEPGKRKRRPTVRALKLARQLEESAARGPADSPAREEGERHEQGKAE